METKKKGYGSTSKPTTTPPRDDSNIRSSPYTTQNQDRPLIPRNESAGGTTHASGTTAQTNETEPLLGEQLLMGNDDEERSAIIDHKWLSIGADASTIEKLGSDHDTSGTPARHGDKFPFFTGSPSKKIHRPGSDPHIGINVELDTLAYSRDPDESTLLTNDNFTKRYLSPVDEEGGMKGLIRRIFSKSASIGGDPAYILVCLGLAVGIGLCSIATLAYVVYNHHHGNTVISNDADFTSSSSESTWHGVPFTHIGRESFGDPVSNIFDVALFHPTLLYSKKSQKPSTSETKTGAKSTQISATVDDDDNARKLANAPIQPFLQVPFPTGAFWTNLVLLPRDHKSKKQKNKNQYSYPIVAYPYSYQWSALGKLQASYSASRRVIKANSIQDAFAPDITFGSMEEIHTRHVVKFDSLSVTLRFSGSSDNSNWETYVVQGSPYITAKFSGMTPELTALSDFHNIACPPTLQADPALQQQSKGEKPKQQKEQEHRRMTFSSSSSTTSGKKLGICAITADSSKRKKVATGVQFVLTSREGLVWLVFASEPITFEFNQAARHVIKSKESYGGVIRLALVPPPTAATAPTTSTSGGTSEKSLDIEQLASSPGVKRLIYHAGAYPVGGTVSWDFRSGARNPLATSTYPNIYSNKGHRRASENVRKYPTTAEAPKEHNIGRITFAFDTIHMTSASPNTNVPLLTLSLPHHAASISSAEKLLLRQEDFDLVYRSIKGRMVPVVGNTWSYEEELTSVGFGDESLPAKTNIAQTSFLSGNSAASQGSKIHESTTISKVDQSIRDLIMQTVESDLKINLPVLANGAYGFGKQIARMAQLAHIAEIVDAANVLEVDASVDRIKNSKNSSQSNLTSSPASMHFDSSSSMTSSGTARRGYALLEKYLSMWLVGDASGLVYDAELGGILSKEGMKDMNADFGNARYNDHHFHYGYVLYAAAILGRADPKFISQYGPYVDAVFYDVAHSSAVAKPNSDKEIFFPLARHKSWFDGHSFASGLFPFANGKSQESSSEAVNCYYGAYLWARLRWGSSGDHKMVDLARLLLATEVTGAKTYWHMLPTQDASGNGTNKSTTSASASATSLIPSPYNSAFRKNYMIGNLGMTDATCTTWFGTENIYVHLINFMPVTAITAELFDKGYVKGERSVLGSNDSVENAWKGYSICNEAILDPNNAWIESERLISNLLDSGLSKSQVLFWVSTREGFSSRTTVEVSPKSDVNVVQDQQASTKSTGSKRGDLNFLSSCSSHEKCVVDSLEGSCCPTNEGIFLRCCS